MYEYVGMSIYECSTACSRAVDTVIYYIIHMYYSVRIEYKEFHCGLETRCLTVL